MTDPELDWYLDNIRNQKRFMGMVGERGIKALYIYDYEFELMNDDEIYEFY